jgi:hypothetical protein
MTTLIFRAGGAHGLARYLLAVVCALLVAPGNLRLSAQQPEQAQQTTQAQATTDENVKIPAEQLDALVAPIALYPDNLLSQTLVASTYPLELMQLEQWLQKNQGLKDKALADAVAKQPWDPSVQAMAGLPQVVKRLTDDIQWTTDLGNAFLAQQGDVMDAIQRMRMKAKDTGALVSSEQQKVETKVEDGKTVVVVEQAQPDVVYVPQYNPVAVWGTPAYPYPSIYYPAYTPGAVAASAISFGAGVAMGALWSGGWGWGAGWGHNDIDLNVNNNFNRNANISNRSGNINRAGQTTWRHNPQHRGGAPYANRATANRFGSNARGESLASRQKGAQQQIARQKGNLGSVGDRGGLGSRPGGGTIGGGGLGTTSLGSSRGLSGGDRIGSRSLGAGASARSSGFGGGSGGFDRGATRASSSRGMSSMRSGGISRGGGGGIRGGGGGGFRGGGRR